MHIDAFRHVEEYPTITCPIVACQFRFHLLRKAGVPVDSYNFNTTESSIICYYRGIHIWNITETPRTKVSVFAADAIGPYVPR